MSEFKKGQLVAVKVYSDENWEPAIFERKEGIFCICRSLLNREARLERPWAKAKPAEEVWPDIFLGLDRSAADQAVQALDQAMYALEMESALVQRLRKQIAWLCRQIMTNALHRKQSDFCPPLDMPIGPDGRCQRSCIACWEQASLKAVEDAKDE